MSDSILFLEMMILRVCVKISLTDSSNCRKYYCKTSFSAIAAEIIVEDLSFLGNVAMFSPKHSDY